ncbi:hypothetical protein F5X68DRAFT_217751 [Plectosphaerella plurivora]|uniref:Small nuclear ribonucleoprotein Prp3 C-terminal domain-containing protein n=1 Tax=Plectosphaerella plurivora TaxID=936078 RepID=A0A9P8V165_9PEZI|nr:hypothetical protein F5X68DRAFT_217751 [Plectosphaerella plurivora]
MAMYPTEEEVTIDSESEELLVLLRKYCEENTTASFKATPSLAVLLTIAIEEADDSAEQKKLQLDISVPFSWSVDEAQEEVPRPRVRIRQPHWLSRASTFHLSSQVPQDSDDLFSTIQSIQEAAVQHLEEAKALEAEQAETHDSESGGPLVRVWFYFPSISTRSKRDDFIINAPLYQLTGFLCAGKPGLLCLEGNSQKIDDYMKFIKTESWGDIPAHHKKVSERHREKDIQSRVFPDMQEITDSVGERRGQRANRGDMKAMEGWLVERGLGDAFAKVLM